MSLSPIAQTLQNLAAAQPEFASQLLTAPDNQPGWLPSAAFTQDNTSYLADALARVNVHYKSGSARPAAALWFGHYALAIEAVVAACYLSAHRVPDLNPRTLFVRLADDGDTAGLAWTSDCFAALTTDPAASDSNCLALPSADALRAHLREQLAAHLTPLVQALSLRSPFGKPGMWALAADYCANAFAWVGELMGQQDYALAEARLLSAPPSRLYRKRDFILIEQGGLRYPLVDRASCCLYYCVEGGEYCSSCPHRPRDERVAMIEGWLQKRAASMEAEQSA